MPDNPARVGRAHLLAERQEAIEEIRLLDAQVEALVHHARGRRRLLLRRVRRLERAAESTGGVNRPWGDELPWWAREIGAAEP